MQNSANNISFPGNIPGFANFGHIQLDTMPNTRDLGGMPTSDGKRIAPGKLIRSGELHNISSNDAINILGEHNVRCVIDLRTDQEASAAPDDAIIGECARYHHLPVFGADAIGVTHGKGVRANLATVASAIEDIHATVMASYESALFGEMGIKAYKEFMEIVVQEGGREGAVLWHCSAGKDRTGIGAILVEHALGVNENCIRRDYLATNIFSFARNKQMPYCLAPFASRIGIDIAPLFYVFPEYYDEIMRMLDETCGGIGGYVHNVLGVSSDMINQMRYDYLV